MVKLILFSFLSVVLHGSISSILVVKAVILRKWFLRVLLFSAIGELTTVLKLFNVSRCTNSFVNAVPNWGISFVKESLLLRRDRKDMILIRNFLITHVTRSEQRPPSLKTPK